MNWKGFIYDVRTNNDGIRFRSGEYSYLIQAISKHVIRMTGYPEDEFPSTPTVVQSPTVHQHADPTIATGGAGQEYRAPIVTSKSKDRFVYRRDPIRAELGEYQIDFNETLRCIDLVNAKRTLHFYLPAFNDEGWVEQIQVPMTSKFYGGGVRNGIVNLNDQIISIENDNVWTKGGVTSPNPFFWSTEGFGILANTFTPGSYDFSNVHHGLHIGHHDPVWDIYLILGESPQEILGEYHKLTGAPAQEPWFSFYPVHLNAYNRDYWVPVTKDSAGAVKFADGYYKEYQPIQPMTFNTGYRPGTIQYEDLLLVPNVYGSGRVELRDEIEKGKTGTAIHENLNGETNPEFSGRAVIQKYRDNDMPLGWFFPNDGYGAGYGQSPSFEGDLDNLKQFTNWAKAHGISVGLWTQAKLEPLSKDFPKKNERDIDREIGVAGISAVKTDVAWVGEGYTFGINATTEVAEHMRHYQLRPMIITVDGWAGSQRSAMIWSGDQTGGHWENIRTQVATYISSGLSGMPNIASDVDGIYGGLNPIIYVRDLEWKSFTQTLFSMDGWGDLPKRLGMQFDSRIQAICRAYVQYHVALVPYLYTLAHQATQDGSPIVRPLFWLEQSDYTLSSLAEDEFLVGDDILVAPIMADYHLHANGSDKRPSIYLPDSDWYDMWSNRRLKGKQSYSDWRAPLEQLPVFIRAGAIIPVQVPALTPDEEQNKRIIEYYPATKESSFVLYEDDRVSLAYKQKHYTLTPIEAQMDSESHQIRIEIHPTTGAFSGNVLSREFTIFVVSETAPSSVNATNNGETLPVTFHFGKREDDPLARQQKGVTIDLGAIKTKHDDISVVIDMD